MSLIRQKVEKLSIRLTATQHHKLTDEARRLRLTKSDVIRDVLEDHFNRQKESTWTTAR